MARLSIPSTRTLLKIVHWLSACGWIGGGFAVLVLLKLAATPVGHEEAEVFQQSIAAIDDDIIIPSALAATVSGLALAPGRWGSGKPRWIMGKCLITACLLTFGALWLKPGLQSLACGTGDCSPLLADSRLLWGSAAAILQTAGLLLLVGLSIVKPDSRGAGRRMPSVPARHS